MKHRINPLAVATGLNDQLRAKSRQHRGALHALAEVTGTARTRRNNLLPLLSISTISLDDLRTSARKLRRTDPAHVREVASTITALGFCCPILVGKGNLVIDGEIRLEAARMLGLAHVLCVRVDHLTPDEQRLLRLAVNRLGEKGAWELDELKIEFEELILSDAPIEVSGFSIGEIDQVPIGDEADAVEPGPLHPEYGVAAIAQLGDVFQLGVHRIVCGDATDPAVLNRLMEADGPARILLTDQPYNVKVKGHVSGSGHREFPMASREMSDDEFLKFNDAWTSASLPHLVDGEVLGTFIDWRGYPAVHASAVKAGLLPLNLIVWGKTNAGMGSLYRSQHELLPLFKKGEAAHVNNVQLGKRGRWRSNLWRYPGASSLGSDARRGLQDHPTVKPTAMLQDALLDLTQRGEIVLDPFLGSGSTLMAAEATGRVCRGVEPDPLYVDVIVRRWQANGKTPAVFANAGESFAQLEQRRTAQISEHQSPSGTA